jgi:dipeptidyl aminopeptidase/acylaminoacyl peptidase
MLMNINRRQLALAAAAALPLPLLAQEKSPAQIPVEAFFAHQQLSQALLNPSGSHVALCVGGDGGRRRLVVLDLATMKTTPVAALKEADVQFAHWVNDQRLLFAVHDENGEDWGRGFYAVDANGDNFKRLGGWGRLLQQGPQQDDTVLISRPQDESEGQGFLKLLRINTRSGREDELDVPPWSTAFLIDAKGEPLAALTERGDKAQLRWREPDGRWRQLREFDRFYGDSLNVLGLGPDGTVYVSARRGHDQTALYSYDPKTDALSAKPLLALAQFDLEAGLIEHRGKLVGLRVTTDATTTVWLDEAAKGLQAKVDAKLPATANLIEPPRRGDSPWILVWAFADRRPGRAMLYHRESDKLTLLGNSRPQIDPALMSGMDYTPYKARDGRTIPAYLTLPRSAGERRPLPLVVMVHGGPHARGAAWGWDAEVQFLASRGYAVLQPEFRGSTGFGDSHFKAGWKQWGLAMQDDLADGVQWAIQQGVADPKRVAILGGSYGGYAAMMGLVKHPELYACAVNMFGVTDLELLFSASWSDQPGVFKTHGMTKIIGDRVADAERLKATSPLQQAKRITKPVLLAYGREDRRVPIEHGERMRDALRAHNANVDWVLYDKEGHGFGRLATQRDFWGRVEKFLAKHLAA